MENSYKAKVYCKNCDFKGEIEIPKGQTIENTKCTNCGNAELMKNQSINFHSNDYGNGFDL